ncbi:hypothetical protein AB6A40_001118 [Gnathostoma spinigerum]|uniref:DUF1907 domain-containing protein n=1 Tax=Gnathostoma spinigerum TaxID=75299 RepID=A0ABD6E8B7_9BILA
MKAGFNGYLSFGYICATNISRFLRTVPYRNLFYSTKRQSYSKVRMEELVDCSSKLDLKLNTHFPQLEELATVISEGLRTNFGDVHVSIVDCPDLQKSPFNMTGSFFGSDLRIGEVGGTSNLFPDVHLEKTYDLREICKTCELPQGFVFGPGAGPFHVIGNSCEMVADANFKLSPAKVSTKIAKIVAEGKCYEAFTISEPKFSLMANLAISNGGPSKVLKICASRRTGVFNFPEAIRATLFNKYVDKLVSLGGVFILKKGTAKLHIMPDVPQKGFKSISEIADGWLRYFEMKAPLICASVVHSTDSAGHKLRLEHTHCYSDHGDAGHYHYDITPDSVEYEGYFAPAKLVYRIDKA